MDRQTIHGREAHHKELGVWIDFYVVGGNGDSYFAP
jgi:hypothetical protein